jgi:colanic acid biosynthesis glycosyl transferase WcaI
MAHILFVSYFFAPDGLSTAVLMSELAQDLRAKGHRVTVLTTTPHYNDEPEAAARQPLRPYWGRWVQESELNGIRVLHVYAAPKGSRVWSRALDYARYHVLGTLLGLFAVERPDVLLAPSPPLTIGLQVWLLGLVRRAPFVYNVQEIYPDIAVKLGVLRNRALIWAMEEVEQFIYRRAARVSVISERFRRTLETKQVPADKLRVIANFVDTDFVRPAARENAFSAECRVGSKFTVLYAGNIGLTQGLETVLEAAQRLAGVRDIQFLIVGGGARREWLAQQLAERQVTNVTLLAYQPRSRVPEIYASADLCLVPMKAGTARDTFPSKVYTIMAAGRGVVASAEPDTELAWVVEQAGCGWVIPPEDAAALSDAVQYAYAHREELLDRGARGRTYVVAHHSREAIAHKYDELIREVVAHGGQ